MSETESERRSSPDAHEITTHRPIAQPSVPNSGHATPTPTSTPPAQAPLRKLIRRQPKKSKSSTPSASRGAKPTTKPEVAHTHPKFPNLPPRSHIQYNERSEELFCICRKPDNGQMMVGCDGCDDWFHFKCAKVDEKYEELIKSFFCPYCELEGKGSILWKRKCKLDGCFKSIMGEQSKFCSKKHGLEYMLLVKDRWEKKVKKSSGELNKDQIAQILRHVNGVEQLKKLGSKLPDAPVAFTADVRLIEIDGDVKRLKKTRELEVVRKSLLKITGENVKRLNEKLTQTLDVSGTTKKKGKKVKKVEVCGFDPVFLNDVEFFKDFDQNTLSTHYTESLENMFITLHKPDDSDGDQEMDSPDPPICLLERKKCQKHGGWFAMINEEVDDNITDIDSRLTNVGEKRERIINVLKVDYFEKQAHSKKSTQQD